MARYYRVVRSNPPAIDDFLSNEAKHLPLFDPTPERQERWRGISVYATWAQARRSSRAFPGQGQYIAALELGDEMTIRVERTGGPGHHTVWGSPEDLLRHVVDTERVDH